MVRKLIKIFASVLLLAVIVSSADLPRPVIIEKEVTTEVKINMLDKDEVQRTLENLVNKVNELQKEVDGLKARVTELDGK